jgi:hypothetical protein
MDSMCYRMDWHLAEIRDGAEHLLCGMYVNLERMVKLLTVLSARTIRRSADDRSI